MKNVIDIGSGTGILLIIANHFGIGGVKVALDNMDQAIKCTEMNSKIHGFGDQLKALNFNIQDVYYNKVLFNKKYED